MADADGKLAYVVGMAAGALIEAMGMQAENQQRINKGEAPAYREDAFRKLMEDRGLHHNNLVTMLRD